METTNNLILLFQILYGATAVGTMIVIIAQNRNPVKTISWVLVLTLLPLVGLIIYYFFGEDNRKRRLISRHTHTDLNKAAIQHADPNVKPLSSDDNRQLVFLLNRNYESPLYDGSKVTFYSSGKEKFDALVEELEKAKNHIHIQYYIYLDDNIGRQIGDILVRKAQQGVDVRLMYDDVGSMSAKKKFFDYMSAQGVMVQPFLEVAFRKLTSRVNYRNHRKVVIIDGSVGFFGGMNIADRYINGLGDGIWRDSHIKLEGKGVSGLQTSFLIDWYSSRNELLTSDSYFPPLEAKGNNQIQLVTGGPVGEFRDIMLGVLQAISTAKKCIYIQTPYFVPTDALLLAIQIAAMRGIDVRVMVPRKSDSKFVHHATFSFLKDVIEAGVKVYLFDSGFLHSKLMVVDDDLTVTGSANMDVRSFEYNFEIEAFIYNEDTNKKAKEIFCSDMKLSSLMTSEDWENQSRITKFKQSVVRMFSPLL